MQRIVVATPPFQAIDQLDKVISEVGADPAGLKARYVGTADDGKLRVVTLWDSKADADRFFAEKLGPALARTLGPEPVGAPEMVAINVERSHVPQPTG